MTFKPGDIVVVKGFWDDEILLILEVRRKNSYKVFVLFCSDKYRVGEICPRRNLAENQYKTTIKNLMDVKRKRPLKRYAYS